MDKSFFSEPKKVRVDGRNEKTALDLKDALTLFGQFDVLSRIKFLHVKAQIDFLGKTSNYDYPFPHYRINMSVLSSLPDRIGYVDDLEFHLEILPLYQEEGWNREERYNKLIDLRDDLVNKLNILDSLRTTLFKWEDVRV